MPSDLIYREDAKDYARHAIAKGLNVLEYLGEVPAANFRPVVTCEECVWHVDDGCHNCTKLGILCPDDADFYCKYGRRPNCGADMRGET